MTFLDWYIAHNENHGTPCPVCGGVWNGGCPHTVKDVAYWFKAKEEAPAQAPAAEYVTRKALAEALAQVADDTDDGESITDLAYRLARAFRE